MRRRGPKASRSTRRRSGPGPKVARSGPRRGAKAAIGLGPLVSVRLRVRVPQVGWIPRFSREHPDLTVVAMNRIQIAPRVFHADVQVIDAEGGDWTRTIGAYPEVYEVQRLDTVGRSDQYRVTYRATPYLTRVIRQFRLTSFYPVSLQAGHATIGAILPRQQVGALIGELRRGRWEVTLESIHGSTQSRTRAGLTLRQQQILSAAMTLGYFAVPRRVTLTHLAQKLGISKSALSEILAVARQKVLQSAQELMSDPRAAESAPAL